MAYETTTSYSNGTGRTAPPFADGFATTEASRMQMPSATARKTTTSARMGATSVSPLLLSIALSYYVADRWPGDVARTPVSMDAAKRLIDAGLLADRDGDLHRTEGLMVWLDAICNVPFPRLVQQWVMPVGGSNIR